MTLHEFLRENAISELECLINDIIDVDFNIRYVKFISIAYSLPKLNLIEPILKSMYIETSDLEIIL